MHPRMIKHKKIIDQMHRKPDSKIEKQNAKQVKFIKQNTWQAMFFDRILIGSLSY